MTMRSRFCALIMSALLPLASGSVASILVVSTSTTALAGNGGGPGKGHFTPHDCWDEGQGGAQSCLGLDPQTTGCSSSAYSVYTPTPIRDSAGTQLGTVELRYSKNCGANWSRTIAFTQFAGALSADAYNTLRQHEPTDYGSGTLSYSYMIGGYAESDEACGSITWEGGSGSACTSFG